MRIVYLNSDSPYIIGKQGETNAVTLRVDVTQWAADFPGGTGVILFTRPNKVVYPLETSTIELDGKTYLQTIVTTKENNVPGWVVLQAQWYNGETLVKSMLFSGKVLASGSNPVDPTETVPDWVTEWMETFQAAVDGAKQLIDVAETIDENLAASQQAVSDSEAWAKGTRSGEAVESTDETYHNNSKYYSEQIAAAAEDIEAWANGTRGGVDIDSSDPAYHKNGKYYNTQAADSAAAAAASASEAMTDTPEGYSNVVASIAATYDGTATYAVGDYCLNGGDLYRCITAIEEAEAEFNSAHWTQVSVGEEVSDLRSDLDQVTDKTGYVRDVPLSAFGFRDGYGVRYATGYYGTSERRSEGMNFIPISGAEEIVLTMVKSSNNNSIFGLAFYTGENNSTFISNSGIQETTNASENGYEVRTIKIPSGANYFRTSWLCSTSEEYGQFYDEFSCHILEKSGTINERIDGVDERIDGIDERLDEIDGQISASETSISHLEEKVDDIDLFKTSASSLLYRKNLPDHYKAVSENPDNFDDNEYIQKRMNEIPAGKHFIFVTDTHWDGNKNARNTNYLIQYVRSRIGDVDVVFGGDVLNKNTTKYQAVQVMRSYLNESIDAYGKKFIPAIGNHDVNSVHQWNRDGTPIVDPDIWYPPYSVIAPIWLDHLNGRAVFRDETDAIAATTIDSALAAEYEAYFRFNYCINTPDNTTYIVLNSGAGGPFVRDNLNYESRSSEIFLHYGWLYNALMAVPSGNDVVLVGHQLTDKKTVLLSSKPFTNLARMMSSFVKKQLARLYLAKASDLEINEWVQENEPEYDFTNAPDVGKVLVLQGHWHQDFVVKFNAGAATNSANPIFYDLWNRTDRFSKTNGDVPIISTICDKYDTDKSGNEEEGEDHDNSYVRKKDSVTEQAFDVVTITDSGVVTTRFGGVDTPDDLRREMIFED